MPRVEPADEKTKLADRQLNYFEDDTSKGRPWISGGLSEVSLQITSYELLSQGVLLVRSEVPTPARRVIRGVATFGYRSISVFPRGGRGMVHTFKTIPVDLCDRMLPADIWPPADGPICLSHWASDDHSTPGALSLSVALDEETFSEFWTVLNGQFAGAITLKIGVAGYDGAVGTVGFQWGPDRMSPGSATVFIQPEGRPEVRQSEFRLVARTSSDSELARQGEALAAAVAPQLPSSNLSHAVREAMNSLLRAGHFDLGPYKSLDAEFRQFVWILETMNWLVVGVDAWSGGTGFEETAQEGCVWQPIPVTAAIFSERGEVPQLPSSEISDAAYRYLGNAGRWASPTVERLLLHALVQAETLSFAKEYAEALFKQSFGWEAMFSHAEFDGSLLSVARTRVRRYFLGWAVYFVFWIFAGFFVWAGLSSGPPWVAIAGLVLGAILVLRSAWVILVGIFRLFVRDPKAEARRKNLDLLQDMARLADGWPQITSPHQAAAEIQRLEAKGAAWPRDTWALVQAAITRGQSYWGPPLSYRRYQTRSPKG